MSVDEMLVLASKVSRRIKGTCLGRLDADRKRGSSIDPAFGLKFVNEGIL